jgi:hypothetical protein
LLTARASLAPPRIVDGAALEARALLGRRGAGLDHAGPGAADRREDYGAR